jgi:class 3 adenylate cyclase
MVAKDAFEMVASAVGFATKAEITVTGERISGRPEIVLAGAVKLTFHNQSSVEETVRVEYAGSRDDAVSAAAALNHPSFRSFFAGQLLAHGEHVRVRHLAFLFVQTLLQQDLFETLGDGEVCVELSRLDAVVAEVAREHEGEVVPSSMSVLVIAFPSSIRALRAALALRARMNALATRFPAPIAVAVHDGRCIALTRGGKPEFFGETLHRGAALLQDCPPNGIALSASVMSDHAVAVAVHESALSVVVDKTQEGPYAGRRVTLLLAP